MEKLLFGTGGTPHSAAKPSTIQGIERLVELGLGCMELEFVQRVNMSEDHARLVAGIARSNNIKLSAHAPYYINLNSREPDKVVASRERLLKTARVGAWCGVISVAFHAAFYMGDPPEMAYGNVKRNLEIILEELHAEDNRIWIRPELMGKSSQFGTLEELLELSAELDGVAPCIDFAHWHARNGINNSYDEFCQVLSSIEKYLGRQALDNMHIHVAGIEYGQKGERRHLNLEDSDFNYKELLQALKDFDVKGLAICESPNLEEDALLLQNHYTML